MMSSSGLRIGRRNGSGSSVQQYSAYLDVWSIGERLREELLPEDNNLPSAEVNEKIGRTLGVKYYLPIHIELRDLLKTKLFLIDGVEMPESFTTYLMHSVMDDVQRRLREEDGINTSSVPGVSWPVAFPDDVKAGLDKAIAQLRGDYS